MTKTDEIALLDKMIKAFGPESYLGPWLADNRLGIVADIGNDLPVDIMWPGNALRKARSIIEEATKAANLTREKAAVYAKELTDKAHIEAANVRHRTQRALVKAAEELD